MRARSAVTLLTLAVFLLSAANLYRAVRAFQQVAFLQGLGLSVPPYYLIGASLGWGLVFMATGAGLWRRARWGRRMALVSACLYTLHTWINHLTFDASDYARLTWPFQALASALGLACVWGILMWPAARREFH